MSTKIGPNEPCPCSSGRKFKKCCGGPNASSGPRPYTADERANAIELLDQFIDETCAEEEVDAFQIFWGRYLDREGQLSEDLRAMSRDVQEMWFACDYVFDDGTSVIGDLLAAAELTPGERSFLETLARSSMRLYEVTDKVPGSSLTLRDLIEGTVVTVSERTASRTLVRRECLAGRVVPRGPSGRPELERGLFVLPGLLGDQVIAEVRSHREDYMRAHVGESVDGFFETLPPMIHDRWVAAIFDPVVPRMANTDGEEMIATRMEFDVADEAALVLALDSAGADGVSRTAERAWRWGGANSVGTEIGLAAITLGGRLAVEANSVARGVRARELVERIAGGMIRHRSTTHEDVQRLLRERLTARALGEDEPQASSQGAPDELDPDVAEAVVSQYYARHYRAWVDEPVPALDGRTPRVAATEPAMRARVEDLIRGLEGIYERALQEGQPAYDPSWMWGELRLEPEVAPAQPPPLAHERVAERIPGSAEVCQAVAARRRAMTSFSDVATTIDEDELRGDLDLQRFLRHEGAGEGLGADAAPALARPYVGLIVNLELHRRKVFWVDPALAYMLEQTDLDLAGRALRPPFPSCALVFTDRHTLGLGERLLSRRGAEPLRGQILKVVTVYVTAHATGGTRALEVVFAFDALGADLPALVRYDVPADDESVRSFLDRVAPRAIVVPAPPDISPVRGLLRLVLNAILYATSAGVQPELRTVIRPARGGGRSRPVPTSESIFFLPGTIDIRHVRQLQELARAPDGRAALARFMVRGHWRRAAKHWDDQRPRWIEPYWKGPDLAAVIEKAYRLRP